MISVSFFLHPSRSDNFNRIYEAYKDYDIVDEVLVITGTEFETKGLHTKFKFVLMPGPYTYGKWPKLGLLARYTFALSCKNKYVFMQDDDFLYKEETMKKMLSLSTPITGCHYRWCDGKRYAKKPLNGVKTKTAPLILTGGTLVNTDRKSVV